MKTTRRCALVLALALLGWCAGLLVSAHAQTTMSPPLTAVKIQTGISVTSGAAITPITCSDTGTMCGSSSPTWASTANKNQIQQCNITVETGSIRWTDDGVVTPTTTLGTLWTIGNYLLVGPLNIQRFNAIATATTATVTFQCYRP